MVVGKREVFFGVTGRIMRVVVETLGVRCSGGLTIQVVEPLETGNVCQANENRHVYECS